MYVIGFFYHIRDENRAFSHNFYSEIERKTFLLNVALPLGRVILGSQSTNRYCISPSASRDPIERKATGHLTDW